MLSVSTIWSSSSSVMPLSRRSSATVMGATPLLPMSTVAVWKYSRIHSSSGEGGSLIAGACRSA